MEPRMVLGVRRRAGLRPVALVLTLLVCTACSTRAIGSDPPTVTSASPSAPGETSSAPSAGTLSATVDGLSLSVSLDRPSVAPGEKFTFVTTLRNGTSEPAGYAQTSCDGATSVSLSVEQPPVAGGRTWSGIAQRFKEYVLREGMGPGIVPATDPLQVLVAADPCDEYALETMLEPGDTITEELTWTAEIVPGVPALPGPVPFTVSVAYGMHGAPPSRAPDDTGPGISWSPLFKLLSVAGTLDVVGDGRRLASMGEVVDALLGDDGFADWLRSEPPSTWSNANIFLGGGPAAQGIVPAGPWWEVDLFREMGVPRHWAIAFVDPFEARLLSITYCDIPCDR